MLTIREVEEHYQRNVFPKVGRQYEFKSYPDHYADTCRSEEREAPEWTRPDSPWRNHFEVAEYNRHNGYINNFWSPLIEGDQITGWEKSPGRGSTLSIWC